MEHILAFVICTEFQKEFKNKKRYDKAMILTFALRIEEEEEGYYWLDVRIHAPSNYVRVDYRERWTVVPVEGIGWSEERGEFLKEGYRYDEGQSEWKTVSHHDSGWRDGVDNLIRKWSSRIIGIEPLWDWYSVVEVNE